MKEGKVVRITPRSWALVAGHITLSSLGEDRKRALPRQWGLSGKWPVLFAAALFTEMPS